MKHRLISSLVSIFVLGAVFITSPVFAAGTTPVPTVNKQATVISTVNIQHAKIISQEGNTFNISFEFNNREMVQTGVKYGVKLVSKRKDVQFLADEKVYDEVITLPENSTTKKEITYVAPDMLSGTYSLLVFASNSSGWSFGISFVKEVTLTSSVKGFEIVTNSCYLKVEGDKSNTHYNLLQGVDISKDEMLRLNCNTSNHSSDALSLTPSYETRYRSAYGDIAETTGGDTTPIAFAAGKNENFSVVLPKGKTPQVYATTVKLGDGRTTSNSISLKYVVRGLSGTLTTLSLNKDYYKSGDKATLSLLWISSSATDKFVRGDNSELSTAPLSLEGQMTNEYGANCALPIKRSLTRGIDGPKVEIPVSITAKCLNPHISLSLKDANGTVLDAKNFIVKTTSIPPAPRLSVRMISIISIILLLIVLLGIYMKKKNKVGTVLPIALFILGAAILPFNHVSADQYLAGQDIQVDSNLDYGLIYNVNDPVSVTIILTPLNGSTNTVEAGADLDGTGLLSIIPVGVLNGFSIYNTAIYNNATATPGQKLADFVVGVDDEEPVANCPQNVTFTPMGPRWGKITYSGPATHSQYTVHVNLYGYAQPPGSYNIITVPDVIFTIPTDSYQSFHNGLNCTQYGCEIAGTAGYDHGSIVQPPGCTPTAYGGGFAHCFVADTIVTMADGTFKDIQNVKIGDVLKGETRNNAVIGFHRPQLGTEKVYSFNGGRYFVTAEHPFATTDGWKSLNPAKTAEEHLNITVTQLNIGDTLVTDKGNVKLTSIDGKSEDSNTQLYNFILDGDHTYYADGYLVHNKVGCSADGSGAPSYPACPGGTFCLDSTPAPTGHLAYPPSSSSWGICSLPCTVPEPNPQAYCTAHPGGTFCQAYDLNYHNCP